MVTLKHCIILLPYIVMIQITYIQEFLSHTCTNITWWWQRLSTRTSAVCQNIILKSKNSAPQISFKKIRNTDSIQQPNMERLHTVKGRCVKEEGKKMGTWLGRAVDVICLNLLVIRHANIELNINISELSSISIIRVDVVNDHMLLIYTSICQIGASFCWCTTEQEGKVKLCGHPSNSNLSPCHLTSCPCCQLFCFLCSMLFSVFLGFFWTWTGKIHNGADVNMCQTLQTFTLKCTTYS
jgi:hypothetical protein